MTKKTFVREIEPYIELHRCDSTGLAWIENGKAGCGHTVHASIDVTGSIRGMKNRGYWNQDARIVRSHGWYYNIDTFIVSDEYDEICAQECRCEACLERRRKESLTPA